VPANPPAATPNTPPRTEVAAVSLTADDVRSAASQIANAIKSHDDRKLSDLMGRASAGAENRGPFFTWLGRISSIGTAVESVGAPVPSENGRTSADVTLNVRWATFGSLQTRHPTFRVTWRRDGGAWAIESVALLSKLP
jgi:hypothetical protein